jgi:hypothetical protein
MSGAADGPPPLDARGIAAMVLDLARGRREAFARCPDGPADLARALAVQAVAHLPGLLQFDRPPGRMLVEALASLCAMLVPPVLTHALASRWGLGAAWPRFATAFAWCQTGLLIVLTGVRLVSLLAGIDGIPIAPIIALGLYGLWLHWFLVRQGLGARGGQAVFAIVCMHAATSAVVLIPIAIAKSLRA